MFDTNKIMGLTADEVIIINGLQKVAVEAKVDAKKIAQTYKFGIGQNVIEVWHDRDLNNFEYLTHEGVWQARYLHQKYDVKVDADTIFDYYRAQWLIENGFAKERENGITTENGEKKFICGYLRRFVCRNPTNVADAELS